VNRLLISNPRNWWRAVRQITAYKQRSTEPLVGLAQRLHDGDVGLNALADYMNKFFQQVAADWTAVTLNHATTSGRLAERVCYTVERSAVERKLGQIIVYNAPGPDGLPNWILRFCTQLSGPVCTFFMHQSEKVRTIPTRWKEANVIPVPKAHSPRLIKSDLHPISLTATLN